MEKYLPYIIAGSVLLVVILALLIARFIRNAHQKKLGIDGEKRVAAKLRKFAGIRSFLQRVC